MSTALYRRYRPDTFADVIGQEHVTDPLMAALQKNRVNHAYLFSGPRGCGKTTSARILARCLNCAKGPTPTPCGECDSCVELGRGGPGSLDVIEIDAASHGGVDDARDLRERATFAPVRDRYKVFIIDEAHMVTSAGFNALLKIVEEPPEHIKFIFATTEPDKVIGTIRSRTHHYPFRLVPPEPLLKYLEQLCGQEQVAVAPGVLSLVIRAGGGSVRDSLSVLDQLMAGAGAAGLDYELAVSLLGYTHASLLDDVVEAIAAADAPTVFSAVDRVIQTGHDPRRFVEDLLERFRDLIIVKAMPESAHAILRGVPEDQIIRMQTQANQLGSAELSRAADITNQALTEMTGATSPRLHLELLCARILLPAAEQAERGIAARVDRIERRLSYGGAPVADAVPAASPTASTPAAPEAPATQESPASSPDRVTAPRVTTADWPREDALPGASGAPAASPRPAASGPAEPAAARAAASGDGVPAGNTADWGGGWGVSAPPRPEPARPAAAQQPTPQQAPAQRPAAQQPAAQRPAAQQAPAQQQRPAPQPAQQPAPQHPQAAQPAAATGQIEMIRRAWPEILEELGSIRKVTWMNVSTNATPAGFDGTVLALGFKNQGSATNFERGDHAENLRRAIHKVLGIDCQIRTVDGSSAAAGESGPKAPTSRPEPARAPAAEPGVAERTVPAPRPASPPEAPAPAPAAWGPAVSNTPQPAPAAWGPADPEKPVFAHLAAPSPAGQVWGPAPEAAGPAPAAPVATPPAAPATQAPAATPAPAAAVAAPPVQAAPPVPSSSPAKAPQPAGPRPASPYEDIPYSDEEPADEWETPPDPGSGRTVSRYQQLLNQAKAAEARQAPAAPAVRDASGRGLNLSYDEDIPSDDDESIEDSILVGRAAIERILGGRLIEERSLDAS
ncbi:DNA polymerase III subunit gamma and tau [Arthrobacter sp. I2-34]|uniref:DNA-directed DNA polymerase n=1 Tax=Arthrobacter hankyongi TaxID=2904801 RepID=A0ABS9L9U2_9MICC|nr:DNA polymerase III subunit gamma and tau [Arthrobacter hankyongi]MCG2623353.1 DNA polymerase III subunit gamma and tau [Arthrobacter hankyongi]